MGWFDSSEEVGDTKTVDTNGNVNNNIIIQEAADTHHNMLTSARLLYATYFLLGAEVIKLGIYLFNSYKKNIKKRYATQAV